MPFKKECEHFGIDPAIVRRFEVRIERLLRDMDREGLSLFCGSSGSIRANDMDISGRLLVVGSFYGKNHDGGDGGFSGDGDGFLRGE